MKTCISLSLTELRESLVEYLEGKGIELAENAKFTYYYDDCMDCADVAVRIEA
jgi:hypothetical protein